MTRRISAEFETRRQAELAVEHLVQEYRVDRSAIEVAPVGEANTAGTHPSGADRAATTGEPDASASHGRIRVSASIEDSQAAAAETALRQARGGPEPGA